MSIARESPDASRNPRERRGDRRRAKRTAAAWLIAAGAIAAGLGWLYVMRDAEALRLGPSLRDALPLQQLAGHSSQPLLRIAVAFVPAGFVAALALAWIAHVGAVGRAAGLALLAGLVLLADAAASGALAQNERLTSHLAPTLTHAGIWAETACVLIGSLLATPAGRAARRGAAEAANGA